MIPTKLEEWNYDSIKHVAENYMEGDTFDFKYSVSSKDPDEREKLTRSVCAFANTKGGFLIYGVHRSDAGINEIRGLEKYDNYARDFGDKISLIDPTVYFIAGPFIAIPQSDKVLFAIHVPISPKRPHITERGTFYYRTNKGNERMSYHQIKSEFLRFEEREYKLRLLYTELLANREIAESLVTHDIQVGNAFPDTEFETDVIKSLLPDIFPLIQSNNVVTKAILDLRRKMGPINTQIRIIQTLLPTSHKSTKISQMVAGIDIKVRREVLPTINTIITYLETEHKIKVS